MESSKMQKESVMPGLKIALGFAAVGLCVACATPEEKAAEAAERSATAQARIAEKRLELVEDHQHLRGRQFQVVQQP